MEMDMMFWAILTVLFILVEASTAALVSIWFVFGGLVAFALAMADFDFLPQCYSFTIVSIIFFVLFRSMVKKVKPVKEPTNSDRIIGMEGIVLTTIDNIQSTGRAKVNGLDWQAQSLDGSIIQPDTIIVVNKIVGVTIYVSRK